LDCSFLKAESTHLPICCFMAFFVYQPRSLDLPQFLCQLYLSFLERTLGECPSVHDMDCMINKATIVTFA
jgi:hypothetical protein